MACGRGAANVVVQTYDVPDGLGSPCSTNRDCTAPSACVDSGHWTKRVCAIACADSSDCPVDYVCNCHEPGCPPVWTDAVGEHYCYEGEWNGELHVGRPE